MNIEILTSWMPIATAPKDGTWFVARQHFKDWTRIQKCRWLRNEWIADGGILLPFRPSDWRPSVDAA